MNKRLVIPADPPISYLLRIIHSIINDSLHRNSFFLIGSYGFMSVIGFVFWIVVARLYPSDQVGIATTLISVSSLLATISLLGINNAVVRFFPSSSNKSNFFSTVLILVSLAAVISSLVFIVGLPFFSTALVDVFHLNFLKSAFILFILIFSLNSITDSFFISLRKTHNILVINCISSLVKVFLPLLFIGYGSFGVFGAFAVSISVASGLSLYQLSKVHHLKISVVFDMKIIKEIFSFSSSQFISSLFGFLPASIIPLLITNTLGPSYSAYFYMPNLIYGMLISIPRSTMLAMFAEGSSDERNSGKYAKKALLSTYALLIPLVLFSMTLGPTVLKLFGKSYASEGWLYLQLVLLSSLFTPVFYVLSTLLNVRKKNVVVVVAYLAIALVQIVINYLLLPYGLAGLGFASIANQIAILLIFTFSYLKFGRK